MGHQLPGGQRLEGCEENRAPEQWNSTTNKLLTAKRLDDARGTHAAPYTVKHGHSLKGRTGVPPKT